MWADSFVSLQNVIDRKPSPEDENLVEVKFATTPIMSTYLVAFVIGEYDYVESQSTDGIVVRVYTPVGKAEQGKFALEVSSRWKGFCFLSAGNHLDVIKASAQRLDAFTVH